MSGAHDPKEALRARLEWLELMGVSEIRKVAARVEPARRDTPPSPPSDKAQGGLFGEPPAGEPVGAPRRGREERGSAGSPLAEALADLDPASTGPASAGLAAVRDDLGDCRRCRLCEKRTQVVFGVGDPEARLMFVGEGPGADEDAQGEPFVGRAGQLLTKIIEAMGLSRGQVYIANIVKCRPPDNRTPLPDEVATCAPFLFRQIAAIRPGVIVCLGTPSAQTLLGTRETITKIRGTFRTIGGIQVMPTFHPAYLLRNPAAKRDVWEDMKKVMALLNPGA